MNNKTVFVRTAKGEAEASGETSLLFGEAKRVFVLVNNKSTVDDMRKHAAPSLRPDLDGILEQLERDDFIRDRDDKGPKKPASSFTPKIASPKIAVPPQAAAPQGAGRQGADERGEALDFTSGLAPAAQETGAPPAAAGAGSPSPKEFDFSGLVSGAGGGQPKPVEAPPAQPAGLDELDFSSLIVPAAADAKSAAAASKPAPEEQKAGPAEVDFSSILSGAAPGPDTATQEAEARARTEADAKARAEAEAQARMRAQMEAKARAEAEASARAATEARMRAEAEATARAAAEARMRAETEATARAAAEARMRAEAEARARAEERAKQEAEARARAVAEAKAKMRAELEAKMRAEAAAKARAELEAKARAEALERARAEAEAKARADAERAKAAALEEFDFSSILQPAAPAGAPDQTRIEAEARMRAEAEAKARADADARARAEAEAKGKAEAAARARVRAELEAGMRNLQVPDGHMSSGQSQGRSMIATVLFFDVVGYTKQSVARQLELKAQFNALISGLIGHMDGNQRIILDTGDGAAIGFLQHPEDALDVAMKFRGAVTANGHRNYPELNVRAGIHLGPVNVMKDMNGQLNMVGDGINDAQRIMSFAGVDQIYVSRAYFDVISRLTADSAGLFKYQGTQKDKHGRDHQVYQVLGDAPGVSSRAAVQPSGGVESLLQDLSVMLREEQPPPAAPPPAASGEWQPMEIPGAPQAAQERRVDMAQAEAEARARAQQEAARARAEEEAAREQAEEEEAARARDEEAARKLAADQAKAFAEAEKRARKVAEAEEKARQREAKAQAKAQAKEAKKRAKEAKQRAVEQAAAAVESARQKAARKKAGRPMRASHGFPLFKTLFLLIVAAVAAVVGLPNFWPMQAYIPQVEQELSSQLNQPVRVAAMHVATVPAPRLDLEGVTIGKTQQLKIGHVALYFDPLSLASHVKALSRVDVENVSVDAGMFAAAAPWLLAAGSSEKYPLQTLDLKDVRIGGDAPLPAFGGKITFDAYGKVVKASLSSSDGRYGVVLEPKDRVHTHVEVSVNGGSLPLVPDIEFGDLELAGDMAGKAINFTSVSGNLYGGSMTGVARLSWQNGWELQGNASFQSIVMRQALPGLKVSGEMEGAAAFVLNGEQLRQLTRAPHLDGNFRVKDGKIDGIDVAETLRTDTRQAAAGQTHFDTMNGSMRLDAGGVHLKPIKIGAGVLSINGSADATLDGALSGHFLVDTSRVRVGLGTLPLRLSGTIADPVWAVGR